MVNTCDIFKHCPVVGFVPECVFVLRISMNHQGGSLLVIMILYLSEFVTTKRNVALEEFFYYCTFLIYKFNTYIILDRPIST
jgi:hypothetical protein